MHRSLVKRELKSCLSMKDNVEKFWNLMLRREIGIDVKVRIFLEVKF